MSEDNLARKIVAAKSTKRDTKQLIYEHALRLFAHESYARTGLRDIAQAVGIEVASLYTHIEGKNALLFDLMDYGTRDLLQRLTTALENVPAEPLAQLFVLIREHVVTTCRLRNQTLVNFNEIRELNPEQRRKIIALRDDIEQLYLGCIRRGIAARQVREVNAPVVVYGIIAMGRGAATWFREDGPVTAEQLGAQYADQSLRGLLCSTLLAEFGDDPITLDRLLARAG